MDNLDIPSIGELWGQGLRFTIASYQRGYRWKPQQVNQLLNDIMQAASGPIRPYMLQPIVLRDAGNNEFELIDGQQRLTCIWIIIQYLKSIGMAYFTAQNVYVENCLSQFRVWCSSAQIEEIKKFYADLTCGEIDSESGLIPASIPISSSAENAAGDSVDRIKVGGDLFKVIDSLAVSQQMKAN